MTAKQSIPQGYKQTEVGVIPEDWDIKLLDECLLKNPDYGINASSVAYNGNLPAYIRITDIDDEGRYHKENKVSVNNINSEKYYLSEGELVFARTGASVGKTYLYEKEDGVLVFAGFLIRVKPNPDKLNPIFLNYFTHTRYYKGWVVTNSARTGQPGINGNQYKGLPIPLPPKPEQAAIARVLSDMDALIEAQGKLIAKKRLIKQGAMQQLLKPKKHWVKKRLGEILTIKYGKSQHDVENENGKYPIIGTSGVIGWSDKYLDLGPSALIGRKGTIDKPRYLDKPFWSIDTMFYSKVFNENNVKFIYYVFNLIDWKSHNEASGVPSLSALNIENIQVQIPEKNEQDYIASILTAIDAEIETQERKLAKYRKIKEGMMQELLTGKTRLV